MSALSTTNWGIGGQAQAWLEHEGTECGLVFWKYEVVRGVAVFLVCSRFGFGAGTERWGLKANRSGSGPQTLPPSEAELHSKRAFPRSDAGRVGSLGTRRAGERETVY
jgi:hypothetical protein